MSTSETVQITLPRPLIKILQLIKTNSWLLPWLAGLGVIAVPALLTPIVPYIDTIGFAYLHSYPNKYGPQHFFVVQFTYLLPHLISRTCADFGVSPRVQVLFYYLFQAMAFYCSVAYLLLRLVQNRVLLWIMFPICALAFNDAMFLWGGPLAFSLVSSLLAISTVLVVRAELDGLRPATTWLITLSVVAMISHPFALPFLVCFHAVTALLSESHRKTSLAVLGVSSLYALLIVKDSPETLGMSALYALVDLRPASLLKKITDVFTSDSRMIAGLFGECRWPVRTYLTVVRCLEFLGIAGVVWSWNRSSGRRAARILTGMYVVFVILFAISGQTPAISSWPLRILSIGSFLMVTYGCITAAEILERLHIPVNSAVVATCSLSLFAWSLILQREYFNAGKYVVAAAAKTRQAVIDSGIRNAVIDVPVSGLDNLNPFAMRAVPMMLFPDPEIVARGLIIRTDWHTLPRHNTRIVDVPGQGHYLLRFGRTRAGDALPILRFVGVIGKASVPANGQVIGFSMVLPDKAESPSEPLVQLGTTAGAADNVGVRYLADGNVTILLDHWGVTGCESRSLALARGLPHSGNVIVDPDNHRSAVSVDGADVLECYVGVYPESLRARIFGKNPIGFTTVGPRFSGVIEEQPGGGSKQ